MKWRDIGTNDGTPVPEGSKYVQFKVGGYDLDPVESATLAAQEVEWAIEHNPPTGEGTVNVVLVRLDLFTDDVKWHTWLAAFKARYPSAAVYKWYWEFRMTEGLYDF